jgi:hypothetical protein
MDRFNQRGLSLRGIYKGFCMAGIRPIRALARRQSLVASAQPELRREAGMPLLI